MGLTDQTGKRSDTVEQLHGQLQQALEELVTSEDWQAALRVAARFHAYSFANTRLIWAQGLAQGFTPRRVAGYRKWQELGRHVRRGEHGLKILAPVTGKATADEGEEDEPRVVGFRVVHVFDIAQTDGKPLPEVAAAHVEGDLPAHWDRIEELITQAGFDLHVADVDRLGEANGITDWHHGDVVVRASLPGVQRFKTAVHELAHIRLHAPTTPSRPNCRGVIEVEAESVAYLVCASLRFDSAGYSLPYVASWSGGDLDKVAATANRVIGCARQLLTQPEHERHLEPDPPRVTGVPRVEVRTTQVEETTSDRTATRGSQLEEVLTTATSIYQNHLHDRVGALALKSLNDRGISEEAIGQWQLGYAPRSWETLTNALRNEGFSEDLLLESGVVGRSPSGRLYDQMRNRVVFPICDQKGTTRGFAGRLVAGDGPKYLNTPETEPYQKRSLLYGMHFAEQPIIEAGHGVVVEGYIDAIASHQAGFTNVVAAGVTALTPQHLRTLRGITGNVTLAFDGDPAGRQAVERSAEANQANGGLHLQIARLPTGQDSWTSSPMATDTSLRKPSPRPCLFHTT